MSKIGIDASYGYYYYDTFYIDYHFDRKQRYDYICIHVEDLEPDDIEKLMILVKGVAESYAKIKNMEVEND